MSKTGDAGQAVENDAPPVLMMPAGADEAYNAPSETAIEWRHDAFISYRRNDPELSHGRLQELYEVNR